MGGSTEKGQGKNSALPRPFPPITAQSYLPGAAAARGAPYSGYGPPTAANRYPGMTPNSMQPPITNFNTGPGRPPSPSYNPMLPPTGRPPAISYPNMNTMQRSGPSYDQKFPSYPYHRRLVPAYRRHHSSHCRPVVHIIRSDSCSSISTCSTISSCSPRCHRSYSYSTSQQQQQPIILLPIQCQQQQPLAITGPVQGQSQPIVLPSTLIQPFNSMSTGRPQQLRAGPIQYVQATPQSTSTSQLQFISVKQPSSIAPERVLVNSTNKKLSTVVKSPSSIAPRRVVFVNSTNKKQPTVVKPIQRSVTTHNRLKYDLKFGLDNKEKRVLFK